MNFPATSPDESPVPIFGSVTDGITYQDRPAAYAVVKNADGRIAAVEAKRGYYLPGGGALVGETPEETVIREVREELACNVRIIGEIGRAVQYFIADEQPYRMHAVFLAAEFTGEADGTGEYQLLWLEPDEFENGAFHLCHAWALRQSGNAVK